MKIYFTSILLIVLFVAACTYSWYQSTQTHRGVIPDEIVQQ
jgi:hypothetical protein